MSWCIPVQVGDEKLFVRGTEDGYVELCKEMEVTKKDKDTGETTTTPEMRAFKYYANVSQAFQKISDMRIGRAQAKDFKELIEVIKSIKQATINELNTSLPKQG